MCLAACYWARLDAIFYGASAADAARAGFDDAFLYDEFRKDRPERALPATQLLAHEAWPALLPGSRLPARLNIRTGCISEVLKGHDFSRAAEVA